MTNAEHKHLKGTLSFNRCTGGTWVLPCDDEYVEVVMRVNGEKVAIATIGLAEFANAMFGKAEQPCRVEIR